MSIKLNTKKIGAQWWIRYFLQLFGVFFYLKKTGKTDTCIHFLSVSRLATGWYMLEAQLDSNMTFPPGSVHLDIYDKNGDTSLFTLPLYSGRICKRLIHVNAWGDFYVDLRTPNGESQLHFRLVLVTKRFARSRILAKLQTLHPRYKTIRVKGRQPERRQFAWPMHLSTLWKDYCALFDKTSELVSYTDWVGNFEVLTESVRFKLQARCRVLKTSPLISVIMSVHNPTPIWLEGAIVSVRAQIYPYWELCIADDASTDAAIRPLLERYAREDDRIKLVFLDQNGHISAATNSALALARGDWVALLDHDDVLAEHALFWVVDTINKHPACRLIYSDEDKIDEVGIRSDPYFKCDWNQDLFYSQNMFSHLGVYQTNLVREVGGFRAGLEGSQDYDLALRCIERINPSQIHHIPRVLYHWRIHADSTAHTLEAKPDAIVAGERALNEHLARCGVVATAESLGHGYRVRYALPEQLPLVSLIIPTRNGLKLLRQCVESILTKTTYFNYEIIIVDNGSDDSATLRYLEELDARPDVRVLRDAQPFNYSALNNAAVKVAQGEVVGLINNDVEVINGDWLTEMVSHAMRPEIGAVGARLWYSDDTLQHAGVVLGIHGVAGHVHRFLPRGNAGYCGRAALIQSFAAVTGACLVVRKSSYEAVGGLNEVELQVACNDIDFCLKLREAGFRNLWTPYAELYHHESSSRGRDDTPEKLARSAREVAYMKTRWGALLLNDPAYSPSLTLDAEDFSLAWPPRLPEFDHTAEDQTAAAGQATKHAA